MLFNTLALGPPRPPLPLIVVGLSQLSVEAVSLFGVTSFSGGLLLLVMGFSVWRVGIMGAWCMAFGWLRHFGVNFRRWDRVCRHWVPSHGGDLLPLSWGSRH